MLNDYRYYNRSGDVDKTCGIYTSSSLGTLGGLTGGLDDVIKFTSEVFIAADDRRLDDRYVLFTHKYNSLLKQGVFMPYLFSTEVD